MIERARSNGRGTTTSDKTLAVMDLFTPERPEWTVEEACAVLGQSESTVYRYFRSLTAVGLIFSIRPGRYLLGPGIVHYDRQLRLSDPLLRAAEPAMLQLARRITQPGRIFISRIHRGHVMAVHELRLGSSSFPEGTFARGRLAPLFAGPPALAMLAFMDVRAVRALFKSAGGDAADWTSLKRRMRSIRATGYDLGVDDPDIGAIMVSVPLKQDDGGIAGSLSLAIASVGCDSDWPSWAGETLGDAAAQMAALAGAQARR